MKEKLTIRKWLGIITGIVRVVILVGWSPMPFTKDVLISIGLSILSTVSYSFAGVYVKKAFTGVPPLWVANGLSVLLPTYTYVLYFYLIANVGTTKTLSVTFLIPLFGMIWGILFLQEIIAGSMILVCCHFKQRFYDLGYSCAIRG